MNYAMQVVAAAKLYSTCNINNGIICLIYFRCAHIVAMAVSAEVKLDTA